MFSSPTPTPDPVAVDDSAWQQLAQDYQNTHFFELRTGIFGNKGLTNAMHFQQMAVAKDTTVDQVINDALQEAATKIQNGTDVGASKRVLRSIAKSLRWLHPDNIKKINLNHYNDKKAVGTDVFNAVKKLVSKALYSVENINPERGRLIYSVYTQNPKQIEPTEAELKEWVEILDIVEDRETKIG
jgi:hypothetical protein